VLYSIRHASMTLRVQHRDEPVLVEAFGATTTAAA